MAKVLVVRKNDKTIHVIPIENKAAILSHNQRQPIANRWKIEEVEEAEAMKLPFIDPNYITPTEAQEKAADLLKDSIEKDAKIKELEQQLAKLNEAAVSKAAKEIKAAKGDK